MNILNIRSKLRKKLLILYFTNPEKKYYTRELARLLDDSAGNVRNELMKMVKEGLFERENLGNLVFYKLNEKHPLYPEIASIVRKSIGVVGGLKDALKDVSGVKTIFIFGSYAKGEEHPSSDIDLFIIGIPDMDELSKTLREQEELLQREINYHVYSEEDFLKMKKEKNSFILNLIEQPKIFLSGDEECL